MRRLWLEGRLQLREPLLVLRSRLRLRRLMLRMMMRR
jgi:hypothetical protein